MAYLSGAFLMRRCTAKRVMADTVSIAETTHLVQTVNDVGTTTSDVAPMIAACPVTAILSVNNRLFY